VIVVGKVNVYVVKEGDGGGRGWCERVQRGRGQWRRMW